MVAKIHFHFRNSLNTTDGVFKEQLAGAAVHAANRNNSLHKINDRIKTSEALAVTVCYSRLIVVPIRENGWLEDW